MSHIKYPINLSKISCDEKTSLTYNGKISNSTNYEYKNKYNTGFLILSTMIQGASHAPRTNMKTIRIQPTTLEARFDLLLCRAKNHFTNCQSLRK